MGVRLTVIYLFIFFWQTDFSEMGIRLFHYFFFGRMDSEILVRLTELLFFFQKSFLNLTLIPVDLVQLQLGSNCQRLVLNCFCIRYKLFVLYQISIKRYSKKIVWNANLLHTEVVKFENVSYSKKKLGCQCSRQPHPIRGIATIYSLKHMHYGNLSECLKELEKILHSKHISTYFTN